MSRAVTRPPGSSGRRRAAVAAFLFGVVLLGIVAVDWIWQPSATEDSGADPPSQQPGRLDALLKQAESAIERGDSAAAESGLDAILRVDPDHGMALLYRGQLARDRGDNTAALADWRRIGDQPADIAGTARYLEGTVALEQGRAVEAERLFLESIRLHPRYPQPHARLVELYVVQGRRNDVRREIGRVAGVLHWTLDELIFRIVPPWRATVPDAGAALMRLYLKADPDDPYSCLALVEYLLRAEKPREAIEVLDESTARMPRERVAALLARADLKIGEIDEARSLLADFPLAETAGADLLRAHADLAMAEEDWTEAAQCLEWIVAAEPEDATSLYHLGRAWQRLGRESEAREALARASQLDVLQTTALRLLLGGNDKPDLMAPILQDVSRLLFELDYPIESARWLNYLVAMQPRDPVTRAAFQDVVATIRSQHELASRADPFGPNQTVGEMVARADPNFQPGGIPEAAPTPQSSGTTPAVEKPPATGKIVLNDRHAEAGIDYTYFNGDTGFKHLVESMGGGVGVLDFDADGTPDLYLPQGASIPPDENDQTHRDQLFQNRGDGTFRNVTQAAGIVEPRYGQGIACADYDNDGFDDVVVGNYGPNSCFRNNGDGTFTAVGQENGLSESEEMTSSVGFGDLDRDGTLDLFVANYVTELMTCLGEDGTYYSCSPANFEARQDRLFRGTGDGAFEDISQSSGVLAPDGKGLGVLIADLDADDLPDVYVANDTTPNFLFRNQTKGEQTKDGRSTDESIQLVEEGLAAGVALSGDGRAQAGMGIACADFDGNGRLDLHVTNFYQETNTLYLNQDDGFFIDATRAAGLADSSFNMLGFGTQAADFNLDGWPDLFVANGHIDDFSDRGEPWKMPPQVYGNQGKARFDDQSATAGPYFAGEYLGRGVARLDYDGDGRPDLAVVHQDRPLGLLHNESPKTGHGIVLDLRGTTSNRSAIGARILVTAGGRTQTVAICGGDGFFSTNERRQFVGLGDANSVEKLEIHWPNGLVEAWIDLRVDVLLLCREGEAPLVSSLP